jgi:ankyrin repeat protein
VVRLLLEAEAEINATVNAQDFHGRDLGRPGDGGIALCLAIRRWNEPTIQLLFEKGFKVDVRSNDSSMTPLAIAAQRVLVASMRLLLDAGAEVGSRDVRGRTPLAYAVKEDHADAVRLLLERGADAKSADMDGETPLSLVSKNGSEALMRCFR